MRVRLTYSVELEDVPDCVAELLEKELYSLDVIRESIGKTLESLSAEPPHLGLVSSEIDKARRTIASIDSRLNECQAILNGYEGAIRPPEEKDEPAVDQQFYDGEPE
jgi:hypothetical protein